MTKPFRNIYETNIKSPEYIKEKERQHRVKLISIAIITLECMIGISVITYFITQSP